VAQRAAPFLLQAIFNLILYSMFHVYMSVHTEFRRMSDYRLREIDAMLLAYCAGLPVLTLIIAFSIDHLDFDAYTVSLQLSRQSTYCQVRVSQAAEWLLVFVPFITTGLGVVGLSASIIATLRDVQSKLATVGHKARTAGDVALYLFMQRLMGLGLATFFVLIIVIASTSAYTAQLSKFAPAFITNFQCLTANIACVDCSVWSAIAAARTPAPGVLALQLASMSMIVVLFGSFFLAQTVSRVLKERREGSSKGPTANVHDGDAAAAAMATSGFAERKVIESRMDTAAVSSGTDPDRG